MGYLSDHVILTYQRGQSTAYDWRVVKKRLRQFYYYVRLVTPIYHRRPRRLEQFGVASL